MIVKHVLICLNQGSSSMDPEVLFTRLEKIGKGSFGEVFKGLVLLLMTFPSFLSVWKALCTHIIGSGECCFMPPRKLASEPSLCKTKK